MKLELTVEEALILSRAIIGYSPQTKPDADVLINLMRRLYEIHVPLEADGPQGANVSSALPRQAELLPGGVSGRSQSGDEQKRTAQGEAVRWSTGKFDREAVEQISLTPTKIERKGGANGPFLKVMWPARGARGFLTASCFDEKLFPWISARVKQETVFYTVHSGNYTNIVGVKA